MDLIRKTTSIFLIAIKIYMKIKYLLFLSTFLFFDHLNGQKIFKNNDSSLSVFIQNNFYSESFIDSCYLGIHFITIEPQKNGVFKIGISGNLNGTFKKRIEDLILLSTKNWEKNLVDDCIKNKKSIVQPVLFDLNRNCTYKSNTMNIDSSYSFGKEAIYETSTKLLVQRYLLLVESFEQLSPPKSKIFSDCYLLSPCYIGSRPLKKKMVM
jgi:hypothetical protein